MGFAGADVLVLTGQETGFLSPAAVRTIAGRVQHDGMGLVLLHPGPESPLLEALLGDGRTWSTAPEGRAPLDLRVTAPRHPIAEGDRCLRVPDAPCWRRTGSA